MCLNLHQTIMFHKNMELCLAQHQHTASPLGIRSMDPRQLSNERDMEVVDLEEGDGWSIERHFRDDGVFFLAGY